LFFYSFLFLLSRSLVFSVTHRCRHPFRHASCRRESEDDTETEIVTWPVWVNSNFSKRIMGRVSEEMARVLISAELWERRRRKRKGRFVILVVGVERLERLERKLAW
jgi:hypothetical protein